MGSDRLPDALRPTELNDFSDLFREPDGRLNRPLIAVLLIGLMLTAGHFTYEALTTAPLATASATAQPGEAGVLPGKG
jgi:hypothetical protein